MSTHQAQVHHLLATLWAALEGGSQTSSSDLDKLFAQFYSTTWGTLPLESEKGSALATASCIPLWEMLNFISSTHASFDLFEKAKLIQMLTAMYPKPRDRRATYQQLSKFASGVNAAVPLSTETPTATESLCLLCTSGKVPALLESVELNGVDIESEKGKGSSRVSVAIRTMVSSVLPSTLIFQESETGNVLVKCGNDEACPFLVLAAAIWKCLTIAELCGAPEKKQLLQYLSSSGWASKTVEKDRFRRTYASLFSPLTTMCMVCLSCNSFAPSTSADNVPLFDPHIVSCILHVEKKAPVVDDQVMRSKGTRAMMTKVPAASSSVDEITTANVMERLTDTVPKEIEFMGTSSTCRDCDRVTLLCREILFSPLSSVKTAHSAGTTLSHAALFSRKRYRDGGALSEGPSFTPVESSMLDMMSDAKGSTTNTLERLALSWQKS